MKNFLADTTVLVECLRGNPVAKDFLEKNRPSISIISRAELIQGCRDNSELKVIGKFCQSLEEISLTGKTSQFSLEFLEKYHLSHGLLFLDALIAATAITENLTLVTGNFKHFSFLPDLDLKDWKDFDK